MQVSKLTVWKQGYTASRMLPIHKVPGILHRQLKLADPAVPYTAIVLSRQESTEQCRGEAVSTDIVWTVQFSMSSSKLPVIVDF